MKWIARVLVFAICLSSGIAIVGVVDLADNRESVSVTDKATCGQVSDGARTTVPAGLHISYLGWRRDDVGNSARLRIGVRNGLGQPVEYRAHTPQGLIPILRINGKDIDRLFFCGTGIKTYLILPGQTVEVEVDAFYFTRTPKPGDRITVGFYLRPFGRSEYEIHYSEPFVITEEFRQVIIERRRELNLKG